MIKKLFINFFALLGGVTLVLGGGLYFTVSKFFKDASEMVNARREIEEVTDTTVLSLDIGSAPLIDVVGEKKFSSFLNHFLETSSLFELVQGIEHASKNPKVKAVFLRIGGSQFSLAQAQELREALDIFQKSGKKIYVYAPTFGEAGDGTTAYYLATITDKIFMQPQGTIDLVGYSMDRYFLREMMDRYKIHPELGRRESYKGVIETYTENDFSPTTKENLSQVLQEMLSQAQEGIQERFREKDAHLFSNAPYLDKSALEHGLVRQLCHQEEVKALIRQDVGEKASFVGMKSYQKTMEFPGDSPKFALISLEGEVVNPGGSIKPTSTDHTAKHLRKASQDPTIKGILFRINSPGGTVVGAETLWYEVEQAAKKKPVIVSMGTLAASAGYQIACPATKIVANPGTVTGSIGVAAGKFSIHDAAKEFGIHLRQLETAPHAGMWSSFRDFSTEEKEILETMLDHYYRIFLEKVSKGRHLSLEEIKTLAKGQVWTGQRAKTLGLVDELGGILTATSLLKKTCQISEDTRVPMILFDESSLLNDLFIEFFESLSLGITSLKHLQGIFFNTQNVRAKLDIDGVP